jgi:uncharacterized coiled-coil protein SlyX
MTEKTNGTNTDLQAAGAENVGGLVTAQQRRIAALRADLATSVSRLKALQKAHRVLVLNGTRPPKKEKPAKPVKAEKPSTKQTGVKQKVLSVLGLAQTPMDLAALAKAVYGKNTETFRTRCSAILGTEVGKKVRRVGKGIYAMNYRKGSN